MNPDSIKSIRIRDRLVRVAVREGEGVPLVLCNGIGARLELLMPFVDALDERIPVVLFDVPGVGGSQLPKRPYIYPTMACLLGELLDELGYGEVDVLGISWGGALAQQFAFQNPRRCRRLVLVATATGSLMVPASPRVLSKMITPRRYRDPEYASANAATIYGGSMRDNPERAAEVMSTHAREGARRGYFLQLFAGVGWTSVFGLPLVRQRTLILAGDDDPLIPLVNARLMNRLLPNSTLHVYHDGHLGLVTKADELAPRVADFLRAA